MATTTSNLFYDAEEFNETDTPEYQTVADLAAKKAAEDPGMGDLVTAGGGTVLTGGAAIGNPWVIGAGSIVTLTGLVMKYMEMQKEAKTEAEFLKATLALNEAKKDLQLAKEKRAAVQQAAMNMAGVISKPQ